jgi:1-acyl-sn-glycerol-3-phosphate acyltransferase
MERWKLRPAADFGLPLGERLKSLKRETGLVGAAARLGLWLTARAYLRLFHRLRVSGRGHLPPSPPFVLVANHASHLDAPVLAAGLPLDLCDCTFALAAGDTFFTSLPLAAMATATFNALPVWRRRTRQDHLATLRARLLDGRCVYLLFPEGTRTRDGTMAAFKPGLGALVAETGVPIVPCHISGAFDALPPHRSWPRPRRLSLTIGAPVSFATTANTAAGWREVAAAAEAAVRGLAPPTDGPSRPA